MNPTVICWKKLFKMLIITIYPKIIKIRKHEPYRRIDWGKDIIKKCVECITQRLKVTGSIARIKKLIYLIKEEIVLDQYFFRFFHSIYVNVAHQLCNYTHIVRRKLFFLRIISKYYNHGANLTARLDESHTRISILC